MEYIAKSKEDFFKAIENGEQVIRITNKALAEEIKKEIKKEKRQVAASKIAGGAVLVLGAVLAVGLKTAGPAPGETKGSSMGTIADGAVIGGAFLIAPEVFAKMKKYKFEESDSGLIVRKYRK